MTFNPDKINIHELAIEEPERVSETFDPEKDITADDWRAVLGQLKDYRTRQRWGNFADEAMSIKIIDPKRDLIIIRSDWAGMEGDLEEKRKIHGNFQRPDWFSFFNIAAGMKVLDSKKDFKISQAEWQSAQEKLQEYGSVSLWQDFLIFASAMNIVAPSKNLELNQKATEGVRELLDGCKEAGNWYMFSNIAAQLKILDANIDIGLDEVAWRGMRSELEKQRKNYVDGHTTDIATQAANMKILAAEKVEVTDRGLKLIMPEKRSLQSETPEMPETKQF